MPLSGGRGWRCRARLAWLAAALAVAAGAAEAVSGRVVSVVDGDTVSVLNAAGQAMAVNLFGVDAPEKSQAYGEQARRALLALVLDREVRVVDRGQDRFADTLVDLYVGGTWVNLELVRAGWGWYVKEDKPDARLVEAEKAAREQHVGLWRERNPVAPWDWRKRGNVKITVPGVGVDGSTVFISANGTQFHREACRLRGNDGYPTTRREAEAQGLVPCKACRP